MNSDMETNKYLWQPRKNGPIYIRLKYRDILGKSKQFTKSLLTSHWPTARKIRDSEFLPIILDINKALVQLELIHTIYPELEEKLHSGRSGGFKDKRVKKGITLRELHTSWVSAMNSEKGNYYCAPKTCQRYSSISKEFLTYIGEEKYTDDVTTSNLTDYRDYRLTDLNKSKKTVSLELTAIRSMFNYCKDKFDLQINPVDGIKIRRTQAEHNREARKSKRRPPTIQEADILCYNFPYEGKGKYSKEDLQDYAIFCRYTGLRQGEVAQLTIEDFLWVEPTLFVDDVLNQPTEYRTSYFHKQKDSEILCLIVSDKDTRSTKTGLERLVPVADKLSATVKKRILDYGKGPIFPTAFKDKGSGLGRTWLKKAKSVHEEITMHGFRHYATSQMENAGCKTSIVSLLVGHSKLKDVHDGYFHKEIRTLKESIDTVN